MFHKFFQWQHLRRRKGTNLGVRGTQQRSASRDLIQCVSDFAGKKTKHRGVRKRFFGKLLRTMLGGAFLTFTIWFAIESYGGLRILD
ncbi:MAG: hypothetical protein VB980_04445 [Opitutales bacterium]